MVQVPVSVGELIDKLSILQVKKTKITDEKKLEYINNEFELLYNMSCFYLDIEEINLAYHKLVETNLKLWDVEDKLRILESNKDFQEYFIDLARKVYYTNDERFRIKNDINEITNSEIREQKSYEKYN